MLHQSGVAEQAVEGCGAIGGGRLPNKSGVQMKRFTKIKNIVHVYHNLMSAFTWTVEHCDRLHRIYVAVIGCNALWSA